MTRRTAHVLQADVVCIPDEDRVQALQVITDWREADERAFYLRLGSTRPEVGSEITYGDHHAWYTVGGQPIEAEKVGYNFDPDRPLR